MLLLKEQVFSKELSYMKNERIKGSIGTIVELLPDYFFEIPASSTGKYHPSFSLGEGGLVRHTKVVVKIAYELLYKNNTMGELYTDDEKDLIIGALIIHDGLKSGLVQEKYTRIDHPILIAEFVETHKEKLSLSDVEITMIQNMVKTHMGEWTTDFKGNEVLEKPKDRFQRFAHMCDFLGSRKFLDVSFENDDIIG